MATALIRELYDYHRWANRRLFDVALGLGDAVMKDMGKHWSVPTVKGMFAHLCAADALWLSRWKGIPPGPMASDAEFPTMADLRARWNQTEAEQRAFVETLDDAALARPVTYKNASGGESSAPLGPSSSTSSTTRLTTAASWPP